MESPFKILLADDHVMFRRGVRSMIQGMDNVEVVGEAGDGLELLRLLQGYSPPPGDYGYLHAQPPGSGGHPGDKNP